MFLLKENLKMWELFKRFFVGSLSQYNLQQIAKLFSYLINDFTIRAAICYDSRDAVKIFF